MPFFSEFPLKCITIRRDQKEWLERETTFNFSGFVQDQLDLFIELKRKQKKTLQKEMQVYTTSY